MVINHLLSGMILQVPSQPFDTEELRWITRRNRLTILLCCVAKKIDDWPTHKLECWRYGSRKITGCMVQRINMDTQNGGFGKCISSQLWQFYAIFRHTMLNLRGVYDCLSLACTTNLIESQLLGCPRKLGSKVSKWVIAPRYPICK